MLSAFLIYLILNKKLYLISLARARSYQVTRTFFVFHLGMVWFQLCCYFVMAVLLVLSCRVCLCIARAACFDEFKREFKRDEWVPMNEGLGDVWVKDCKGSLG